MIFNRLIPGNIQKAAAPVRYPFLWNAAIQDHTQWPGFAGNGDTILSLARNLARYATCSPISRRRTLGTASTIST